jgi:hypothetical protein
VAELERTAQFKEGLLLAIKSKAGFKTDYQNRLQGFEGTIEEADDRSLKIRINGGGTIDLAWVQFDPAEFYGFVLSQWKYSKEQKRDTVDQCNLAAILMEFGLYEEALVEINGVLAQMEENPFYPIPAGVSTFCAEYKVRLEKGESAEAEEIEAQKRLGRLDVFMKNIESYKAARAEIAILRTRYARTKSVTGSQPKIEEYLQKINKEGGERFNRDLKEERHKALQLRLSEEQVIARKNQAAIIARLNKMDDPFERSVHLGAVYAAAGDWRASWDKFTDARSQGEGLLARGEAGREFLPSLGLVYSALYRAAVLLKDRKGAEAIRIEGSRRFVNPETKEEEGWWTVHISQLGLWSEKVYPVEERKVMQLREEVRANPEDPNRIWSLVQSCSEGIFNLTEARGYLLWLLENHPEFAQVQNGNCTYRLAEIHYIAREVREAIQLYLELQSRHKDHPKVADSPGITGVKRRLDECYKLLNKMGYPREKKP